MRRSLWRLRCAVGALAWLGMTQLAMAGGNGAGAGGTEAEARLTPPLPSVDEALELEYPSWQHPDHGANIGLVVRYRRKDAAQEAWRFAGVAPKGRAWLVSFPDRFSPSDTISLDLTYRFEPAESERDALEAKLQELTPIIVQIALRCADMADPCPLDELETRLQHLSSFFVVRESSVETVREAVLQAAGFVSEDRAHPEGKWSIPREGIKQLSRFERLWRESAFVRELRMRMAQDVDCPCAKDPNTWRKSPEEIFAACSVGLAKGVRDGIETTYLKPMMDCTEPITKDTELARTATPATMCVRNAILASRIQEVNRKRLDEMLALVAVEVEVRTESSGEAMVQLATNRSWYDIATGLVYVPRLSDVVLPVMASVCPAGCLKPGEKTAYWRSLHTLSADFGVKAAVVDHAESGRHKGRLGLLVGLSYNPLNIVRVSSGLYAYESATTDRWRPGVYVGVTANLVQALRILGALDTGRRLGFAQYKQFTPSSE